VRLFRTFVCLLLFAFVHCFRCAFVCFRFVVRFVAFSPVQFGLFGCFAFHARVTFCSVGLRLRLHITLPRFTFSRLPLRFVTVVGFAFCYVLALLRCIFLPTFTAYCHRFVRFAFSHTFLCVYCRLLIRWVDFGRLRFTFTVHYDLFIRFDSTCLFVLVCHILRLFFYDCSHVVAFVTFVYVSFIVLVPFICYVF